MKIYKKNYPNSGGGGGGGFSISLGPNLLISDDRLSLNHDDNDGTYTLK